MTFTKLDHLMMLIHFYALYMKGKHELNNVSECDI